MRGDQLSDDLWNQVVALTEAHDVDVVFGKQPKARVKGGECGVSSQHVRPMTFDLDLFDLGAERVEKGLRSGGIQRARGEPLAEIGRPGGAVGVQEAPANLRQRCSLIHLSPALDPLVGPDESHLGSLRRPLAELGKEEGEARAQPLLVPRADALHDFLGQLIAEQALAVERFPDRGANRLHLIRGDLGVEHALGIPPGPQLIPVVGGCAGHGPPSRMPER